MFSSYGKPHTTIILSVGTLLFIASLLLQWWLVGAGLLIVIGGLMAFFRDPDRRVPTMRGQVVAPADGRVSSIHSLEHYEPFDGPAVCVRIFLSVLDVHVNRAPMHGRISSITHKPGEYLNALKAESAERNESVTVVLRHPTHDYPVAAVRQVSGAIARRIVTGVQEHDILQRGQRFGMIKFGSTTEVYLPHPDRVTVQVRQGQYIYGGETVVAHVRPQVDAPLLKSASPAATPAE